MVKCLFVSRSALETIRAVFDALNRGEVDALFALYAEDVVVDMSETIGPEKVVMQGRDRAAKWWRDGVDHWEDWTWELERATEVPPDQVVTATRVRGRGRGSGADVNARIGQVWRVAGDVVTHVKLYQSEKEALEAATPRT